MILDFFDGRKVINLKGNYKFFNTIRIRTFNSQTASKGSSPDGIFFSRENG